MATARHKIVANGQDPGPAAFPTKKKEMSIPSVVALYWLVSISMVYLNKYLVSGQVEAPMFVTWYQCVVTCLICWVCGELGRGAQPGQDGYFSKFPRAEYPLRTVCKVLPLSIVFVGMIAFNNVCLQYVEVSFYNVARSLTIVFNVILSYCMLGQKTSCRTMACLATVMVGFLVGTNGEVNFSLIGTVSGVLSSVFVSLNSIYTKKVLPYVDNDQWRLTFVNNANACLLFLPFIWYFEADKIRASFEMFYNPTYWFGMTVAGFMGFSIGIVTVMQIRATSPLTHNISGTAKAAVQSVMAFYIWGNQPTMEGIIGIVLVLGGSGLYTAVKMRDSANAQALPVHNANK